VAAKNDSACVMRGYAFARIGAVVSMRVEDYFGNDKRWWVRLHEKGGKRHEMPAHHKLESPAIWLQLAFPQNGIYNYTVTIGALTYWALDAIKNKYLKAPGPLVRT
jgi:hypothetical protein